MPRVVAHYPVRIWLMASAECMGAPTPKRCSVGYSAMSIRGVRHWNHPKPWYRIRAEIHNNSSATSHQGVSNIHRDVASRNGIRQQTQCHSIPLSTSNVHRTIDGTNACGFQSRVRDAKYAIPLCCK
ncbi:hypothetical protein TNCV_3689941 [Trichonephila clavipes]|uniref:Uncharacterized protein n=1 Tax=Trichonephila clavipes TaxID=2585209 RepID=A0A8X6SRG8_TRICX|nr:hypothetical protein TNCV_3689941 [Trichonephila clavipes]